MLIAEFCEYDDNQIGIKLPAFFLQFWPFREHWSPWLWFAGLSWQFQLFSESKNNYSGADVVSDLGAESSVVHQQNVKVSNAANDELFETVGKVVSGLAIWSVTDFGHLFVTSETSAHSVINAWIGRWLYLWVFSSFRRVYHRRDLTGSGWT